MNKFDHVDQDISLQRIAAQITKLLKHILNKLPQEIPQSKCENMHTLHSHSKYYLSTLKQLCLSLENNKIQLGEKFLSERIAYQNQVLKKIDMFFQILQKSQISIRISHNIYTRKTFIYLPQCASKKQLTQTNELDIYRKLLFYETNSNINQIEVKGNQLILKTDNYDVKLVCIENQWRIELLYQLSQNISQYFQTPEQVEEVQDFLLKLNEELNEIDQDHSNIVVYILFRIQQFFLFQEFKLQNFYSELFLKIQTKMDPKFKILIFNPNHKLVKNQKQVQIEFVKCESFNQFDLKTSVYAKIYLDLEMNQIAQPKLINPDSQHTYVKVQIDENQINEELSFNIPLDLTQSIYEKITLQYIKWLQQGKANQLLCQSYELNRKFAENPKAIQIKTIFQSYPFTDNIIEPTYLFLNQILKEPFTYCFQVGFILNSFLFIQYSDDFVQNLYIMDQKTLKLQLLFITTKEKQILVEELINIFNRKITFSLRIAMISNQEQSRYTGSYQDICYNLLIMSRLHLMKLEFSNILRDRLSQINSDFIIIYRLDLIPAGFIFKYESFTLQSINLSIPERQISQLFQTADTITSLKDYLIQQIEKCFMHYQFQ